MDETFTFWLGVLGVLVGVLCLRIGIHLHGEAARRRKREQELSGTPFDVSAIAPQIHRVRQDYLAALHPQAGPSPRKRGMIAAVRRRVLGLPYFRRVWNAQEHQKHDG